jgi:erythromycin esterase-like protein
VRPGLPGSFEALFHDVGLARFLLVLRGRDAASDPLNAPRLQRAIGVIYLPETERQSHYFHTRLVEQFDAIIHIGETHAVEPLERTSVWDNGELPETYPFKV